MRFLAAITTALLLAGCATPSETAPLDMVELSEWQDGQWWSYKVAAGGMTHEAVLVYDAEGERFLLSNKELARTLAVDRVPLTGAQFKDGEARAVFHDGGLRVPVTTGASARWLPNLTNSPDTVEDDGGQTYDIPGSQPPAQDSRHPVVIEQNATHIQVEWRDGITGLGTYNVAAQWFESITLQTPATSQWTMTDWGLDYDGDAWHVEQRMSAADSWNGLIWGTIYTGGGNAMMMRVSVNCNEPGLAELHVTTERNIGESIAHYTEVCPTNLSARDWYSGEWSDRLGYERESAGNPLSSIGNILIDFVHESKIS